MSVTLGGDVRREIVGQSVPMVDGLDKITGRLSYGTDFSRPGQLVGLILRSTYAHARIKHIDVSKAEVLPGVGAVVTGQDLGGRTFGFQMAFAPKLADKMPMETDKVRFIGDEVAAVAAVDLETARAALQLIEVEYEPLDAVFDPEEARQSNAPLVHDGIARNVVDIFDYGNGNVDEGIAQGDVVVENSYYSQPVSPAPMEMHQALAEWDARGRVTMYASTQMPFMLRTHLAHVLGLSEGQVRIVKTPMGGGFGARMEMHTIDPICAILAKKSGRPVKILYSREEEFVATSHRHPFLIKGRLAAKRDGTMTGLDLDFLIDSGAYVAQGLGVGRVGAVNAATLYRIPHVRVYSEIVYTNKPYPSAYRGYGNTQATFALECLVDELAEKLAMDPIELRIKNGNTPNSETYLGQKITSCGYREALLEGKAVSRWEELRGKKKRAGRKALGIGVATVINVGGGARDQGNSDASGAIVVMRDDGSVSVNTGGQEIGTGGMTVFTQIASQELGVPMNMVTVSNSDTDLMPWDIGCHAQRNVFCAGNGVLMAARETRAVLMKEIETQLGVKHDDVILTDGEIRDRAGKVLATIAEIVKGAHYREGSTLVWGKGFYDPPTVKTDSQGRGNKSGAYSFGAQFAEVAVDLDTGEIEILRMIGAHDVGKAINPEGVKGQIYGGIAQGIGQALSEELVYSEGQLMNPNFASYRLPNTLDTPPIEAIVVETPDPEGPYGAKGIGESTVVPTCAAISNAVYDAIGVRLTVLPFHRWDVWRALKDRKAEQA